MLSQPSPDRLSTEMINIKKSNFTFIISCIENQFNAIEKC